MSLTTVVALLNAFLIDMKGATSAFVTNNEDSKEMGTHALLLFHVLKIEQYAIRMPIAFQLLIIIQNVFANKCFLVMDSNVNQLQDLKETSCFLLKE